MIIKPQDIVVLAKLLANQDNMSWSQNSIAFELCLSPSQINSGRALIPSATASMR